jgi:zinc protease
MMRDLRVLLVLLAVVASAAAGDPAAKIETWSLEPGTELVLLEDHRAPLVFLVIELPIGSWSEWAVANHAEQAFELQLLAPESGLMAQADQLGVDLELTTEPWCSRLTVSCLRQDLDLVVGLVVDILSNRELDRRELKRRRKERSLTWKAASKNPHFVLSQSVARLLFGDDDPRRQRWEKPVRLLTDSERLMRVRDQMLGQPGRVIALAGDTDRATVEMVGARLLPPVSQPLTGTAPKLGPIEAKPERAVAMKRINQVYFAYTRPSLSYDDPDWPALMVADHVLGGHFYSRLNQVLRHEGGETYGARTINRGGAAPHAYLLTTYTRAENAAVAEEKLRQVLVDLYQHGISEQEREAAIGFLSGRLLFYRQSPEQILMRYLAERRHGCPAGFHDQLVDRAAALSLDQINDFIRRFYDPAAFTMVTVEPG